MSTTVEGATETGAPVLRHDEAREREHRAAANRAVAVSAVGLALTGAIELAIALLTGSVALLGDALHNLDQFVPGRPAAPVPQVLREGSSAPPYAFRRRR